MYTPNAVPAGLVLSGYALHVGLSEAQIGFLAAVAGFAGLWQLLSFQITRRVQAKRRFAVAVGTLEITAASLIGAVGLVLAPQWRFAGTAALLLAALLFGNTVAPVWNSWFSNTMPEAIRASYIGRRMFAMGLAGIVYLFVAGRWLDHAPTDWGFIAVFAVGWLAGIVGYAFLGLTPYPDVEEEPTQGLASSVSAPLRDPRFLVLALFYMAWTAARFVAIPFYSAYMLQELELSYTRVALYGNITSAALMVGYLVSGRVAQRFGGRAVIQLLIVPSMLAPLMWACATPRTYALLVPLACAVHGLTVAAIVVAVSALLYKSVPAGRENSAYFAVWTAFFALGAGLGPLFGGMLRRTIPELSLQLGGAPISSLQIVFGVAAALSLVGVVLAYFIREEGSVSPRYLLTQFRGNLLSFAYNYALFHVARREHTRADAARGLGRSHTPLALGALSRALDDVSTEVRHEAARGLGELHRPEAVPDLLHALEDDESDVRADAAEALGRIGATEAVEALARALDDPDLHVRTAAALALGAMGTDAARERLWEALHRPADHGSFPTLVEALGLMADPRLPAVALAHLSEFRSPVARVQIINGVCHALGEAGHFDRLFRADELRQAVMMASMLRRVARLLGRTRLLDVEKALALSALSRRAGAALAVDDHATVVGTAAAIAHAVLESADLPLVVRAAAEGIVTYAENVDEDRYAAEGVPFCVVALTSLARFLARPDDRFPGLERR